jgi:hypothetical protein
MRYRPWTVIFGGLMFAMSVAGLMALARFQHKDRA